jgi:hypothetical protein
VVAATSTAPITDHRLSPTPDPATGATDHGRHLVDLQQRIDRLEQALASAGTFA